MIGINRPLSGMRTFFPISEVKRSSVGWTQTAVSPSIVSGRVVENWIDCSVSFPASSTIG